MNYQHSHIYLNLLESQQENNFNEYINYIYLNEKNEDVIFFVKYVELIYSKRISIFNCNPDFCDHCFFQSKCNYKTAQEMINMIFSKEEFYVER